MIGARGGRSTKTGNTLCIAVPSKLWVLQGSGLLYFMPTVPKV